MPPKQPLGSIINGGKSWQVMVPVDRDKETGKLIYLYKTIRGRKRDAVAWRDEMLAVVPPERIAPFIRPRPRRPEKSSDQRRLEARLRRFGIELVDPAALRVRCLACGFEWTIDHAAAAGPLPRNWAACPNRESSVCSGVAPPSSVAVSRAYSRGVGGRRPLSEVPGHELYRQPFAAFTTAELLAAVKYNLRFAPCKRLYWEVIRRDLWKLALNYPLLIRHCEYFLEVVTGAPYHNQTELNRQCERIVAEGVADFLAVHIAEAKELAGRTISMFERDPGVRVPVTIRVYSRKRRGAPDP